MMTLHDWLRSCISSDSYDVADLIELHQDRARSGPTTGLALSLGEYLFELEGNVHDEDTDGLHLDARISQNIKKLVELMYEKAKLSDERSQNS